MLELIKNIWDHGIPCVFHLITGAYCPGCGGTRAIIYLMHGEVRKSFQYHPLVIYSIVGLAIYIVFYVLGYKRKHFRKILKYYPVLVQFAVVIVFANWIYKNYMLLAKGINLLP